MATVEPGAEGCTITLKPNVPGADIRYPTDGTTPTIHSPRYTARVRVEKKSAFRAINVLGDHRTSLPLRLTETAGE